MLKNRLITPEGTRDTLFEDCIARRKTEKCLKDLFTSRGYSEVVTPGIEFYDVFNSPEHGIPQERMYKLTDLKGRILTVRPDLTMPIARLAATRLKGHSLPFRLFYNQSVYMINPALSGRSDEVVQAGIELIGAGPGKTDLEVIATAAEALEACGVSDYRIEIGHIGFFNSLIKKLNLPEDEKDEIRFLIESKNYPALNDKLDKYENREVASALKALPALFGGEEVFEKAKELFAGKELSYLKKLYKDLKQLGFADKISLDLGIVTRNDYYTGIVFKGYLKGFGSTALVGGRYDTLLSDYGVNLPAVGFGIDVDAVAGMMDYEGNKLEPSDVLVFSEEGYEVKGLLQIKRLTDAGFKAELSVFDTFEESQKYAKEKGIENIYIVREDIVEVKA